MAGNASHISLSLNVSRSIDRPWARRVAAPLAMLLAAVVVTMPAHAQKQDQASRISIARYLELSAEFARGEDDAGESLIDFFRGLRAAVATVGNSYSLREGLEQRSCLPAKISVAEMTEAIHEELLRSQAYWARRKNESLASLATYVFSQRWPCK